MSNEPIFSSLTGKASLTVSGAGSASANANYSIANESNTGSLPTTHNGFPLYVNENNSAIRIGVQMSFINNVGYQENWIIGTFQQYSPTSFQFTSIAYAIPRNGTTSPPSSGWYVVNGTAPAPTLS